MSGRSIAQKLIIRENYTVLLLGAPRGYAETLGPLPAGATFESRASASVDCVRLFATRKEKMTALFSQAKPLLKPDGWLWATYPKADQLGTDLKREVVWECGATVGMHRVCQVAIDYVWSALRFRADNSLDAR